MSAVLVTGGTGTLGRHLVPELRRRGHEVRVLSRQPGEGRVVGDVLTGAGLAEAVAGVDVVVHAASSPRRKARATEVEGTRNLLAAAGDRHVVYVSIVGVDDNRFGYYRAKHAAERLVEQRSGPWTIQRATQFHELVDQVLGGKVFVRTKNLRFQPVAAAEVAVALADRVDEGPCGRASDIGGPEVLHVRDLARVRREVTGRAARLLPVPPVGFLADLDAGNHLCPDRAVGTTTWEQWLRTR